MIHPFCTLNFSEWYPYYPETQVSLEDYFTNSSHFLLQRPSTLLVNSIFHHSSLPFPSILHLPPTYPPTYLTIYLPTLIHKVFLFIFFSILTHNHLIDSNSKLINFKCVTIMTLINSSTLEYIF